MGGKGGGGGGGGLTLYSNLHFMEVAFFGMFVISLLFNVHSNRQLVIIFTININNT